MARGGRSVARIGRRRLLRGVSRGRGSGTLRRLIILRPADRVPKAPWRICGFAGKDGRTGIFGPSRGWKRQAVRQASWRAGSSPGPRRPRSPPPGSRDDRNQIARPGLFLAVSRIRAGIQREDKRVMRSFSARSERGLCGALRLGQDVIGMGFREDLLERNVGFFLGFIFGFLKRMKAVILRRNRRHLLTFVLRFLLLRDFGFRDKNAETAGSCSDMSLAWPFLGSASLVSVPLAPAFRGGQFCSGHSCSGCSGEVSANSFGRDSGARCERFQRRLLSRDRPSARHGLFPACPGRCETSCTAVSEGPARTVLRQPSAFSPPIERSIVFSRASSLMPGRRASSCARLSFSSRKFSSCGKARRWLSASRPRAGWRRFRSFPAHGPAHWC